jgi:hypothetical protein
LFGLSRLMMCLFQVRLGGRDVEVQEMALGCSRVVDGSPEGAQFLRIDMLPNVSIGFA